MARARLRHAQRDRAEELLGRGEQRHRADAAQRLAEHVVTLRSVALQRRQAREQRLVGYGELAAEDLPARVVRVVGRNEAHDGQDRRGRDQRRGPAAHLLRRDLGVVGAVDADAVVVATGLQPDLVADRGVALEAVQQHDLRRTVAGARQPPLGHRHMPLVARERVDEGAPLEPRFVVHRLGGSAGRLRAGPGRLREHLLELVADQRVRGEGEHHALRALLDEHLVSEPADARLGDLVDRGAALAGDRVAEHEAAHLDHAEFVLVEVALQAEAQAQVRHRLRVDRGDGEQGGGDHHADGGHEQQAPAGEQAPEHEGPASEEFAHGR